MKQIETTGVLILAAGRGRRAGSPKVRLTIDGKSYLALVVDRLREAGYAVIVAVVSSELAEWAEAEVPGVTVVVNPDPDRGMLSSIVEGVRVMPPTRGVLMVPVDHPLVLAETYRRLGAAFQKNPLQIVKPSRNGKTGHPVMVPRMLAEKIPPEDFDGGLQIFLSRSGVEVLSVQVNDDGILKNLNGPA